MRVERSLSVSAILRSLNGKIGEARPVFQDLSSQTSLPSQNPMLVRWSDKR